MSTAASVSVVIPTRDANETLGAQLDALTRQNYPGPFEVLVVDNGSKDDPTALVLQFEDVLNVRVLDASAMSGASYARNFGIASSAADIVAFCDADDVVDEGWLAALVRGLAEATMVTGSLITQSNINPTAGRAHRPDQTWLPSLAGRPFMLTSNGAAWRQALVDAEGFDLSLGPGEDVDLSWRILDAGGSILFVPEALVHYRLRSGIRQLFRQWYQYGCAETALYTRYRGTVMRRRSLPEILQVIALLLLRWPRALQDAGARNSWIMWAGGQAGRIAASYRQRVIYP